MGKFNLTHEIRCDEPAFWACYFDAAFQESLFRDVLHFDYALLEQTERDQETIRRYTTTPKLDLPGPVAKLVGPNLRIEEQGRFDKASRRYAWRQIPSVLADKFKSEGSLRVEPAGPGRVRRIAEMFVEVKIFGIGGLVESTAEKATREAWDKSAVFHNRWLETHKPA